MWFIWWQLLGKIWADCDVGLADSQKITILIDSPFVALSAAAAFALPALFIGRRWPRAGASVGVTLALVTTYIWFVVALPEAASVPFRGDMPGVCPGMTPPWWPTWLLPI
jgi:hypothetical protein